jgi:hypothetical protein
MLELSANARAGHPVLRPGQRTSGRVRTLLDECVPARLSSLDAVLEEQALYYSWYKVLDIASSGVRNC